MIPTNGDDLADTVGTDVGRTTLLKEIVAKVDGADTAASDDDLDRWWGSVEVDRLASGLTLATIDKLSRASDEDRPAGAWILKSDETGDEPTTLTTEGRDAIRRVAAM